MAEKKCPMSFNRTEKQYNAGCLEECCAWWNNYLKECAILSVSRIANLEVAKKVKDDNEKAR